MCSYGFKRVCYFDGKYDGEYKSYRGVGAVGRFLSDLLGEVEECNKIIQSEFNKVAIMSVKDYDKLEKAVECHICGGKFSEGDKKVLDHCHVTGKFRGAAHNSCNLNFKLTGKIPVVFHNLRGYDGNFIMQGVAELGEKIEVIANNMQKYMSFRVGKQLVFIDSMQFMSSSLEALVGNLDKSRFKRMQSEWQGEELEMLLKKGVYPYEYMSCWEKFDDKSLPEKSAFYSSLYEEEVNDNDYSRACKVYKKFDCKSLGDYHDLYLKTDVLLLADVFEDFRRVCLDAYKLDPAHYISAPGLSWDAMLKRTGVKLDLLSNVDMYQFIEKGMRGGVSYIGHRYAKANNKYMSDYDPEKPSSYIMYLDANNLYGHAMSEELPYGKFRWIDVDKVKLEDYGKGKEKGLILEVDLEYPSELHKLHSDYPLAPEKMEISDDMLSEYAMYIKEAHNGRSTGVKKLHTDDAYKDAANFSDKYDTSGYNKNSPFYDETNKKVIGKFKDEAGGIPIREFIGLRSKMYSYEKDDGGGGKTAKGVKKEENENKSGVFYKKCMLKGFQKR
ncbi:Gastrula zinc finger [Paramuricea clavata]|uniref:Gastrula zinc finger n=1 Tax=Paramuricea clavata TaxID=317549 RepID=A0A7D9EMA0_PARCT|nr:Gastrula zinc finger [Paramuricea clavata]